ncbi:hypothetical protein [Xenorhabdus bovienii]|uniref:hypothetical protein n=1 Tax=Xenorhabdus bovienii TaxID=40576 RepID=UPI0023B2CBEA|nr:hypothetical protein [Xenorhabdus bovienii]
MSRVPGHFVVTESLQLIGIGLSVKKSCAIRNVAASSNSGQKMDHCNSTQIEPTLD